MTGVQTCALPIYDLVGRKTARDGGAVALAIAAQIEATEGVLAARSNVASRAMLKRLTAGRKAFLDAVAFVAGHSKAQPNAVFAGSVPYLMLAGTVVAGWQMARALIAAEDRLDNGTDGTDGIDADFMHAKIATAHFYADHILNKAPGLRDSIVEGADSITEMALDAF